MARGRYIQQLNRNYTYIKPQVEKINFVDPSRKYEASTKPPSKIPPIMKV